MARSRSSSKNDSTANLGFEAKLWLAADKLRSRSTGVPPVRPTRRLARCFVRLSPSNATTRHLVRQSDGLVPWRAVMKPERFRGIEADLGEEQADTFRRDLVNCECRNANSN